LIAKVDVMGSKIKHSVSAGVATVTLFDPATLNSASVGLVTQLSATLTELTKAESGVRCVVLTGEGRGFCSGANIALGSRDPEMGDPVTVMQRIYNPLIVQLRDYSLPLIGAINGPTAGYGCSIALSCDLIVAAESAYFLQAFRRIGLVPDGGATYLLPRLLGKVRAMELALLGDKLSARTALEWGMVNRCVADSDLMADVMRIARSIAEGPSALGLTRKLILSGLESGLEHQLDAEAAAQDECRASRDYAEGVAAFVEKRPARFADL
jgi:2-(1,2-epoxy-1,2-dihydrophenyl)acetyl-CoA isomerase